MCTVAAGIPRLAKHNVEERGCLLDTTMHVQVIVRHLDKWGVPGVEISKTRVIGPSMKNFRALIFLGLKFAFLIYFVYQKLKSTNLQELLGPLFEKKNEGPCKHLRVIGSRARPISTPGLCLSYTLEIGQL